MREAGAQGSGPGGRGCERGCEPQGQALRPGLCVHREHTVSNNLKITLAKRTGVRTSLEIQWLRIRLPMQGTQVRSLVREGPAHRRAAKPEHHRF